VASARPDSTQKCTHVLNAHHTPTTKTNHQPTTNQPTKTQDVNAVNAQGNTPLHWACLNGQRTSAELLLAAGAAAAVLNRAGRTAVDEALGRSEGGEELLALINKHETAGVAVAVAGAGAADEEEEEEEEEGGDDEMKAGGALASAAVEEEVGADEVDKDDVDVVEEVRDQAPAPAAEGGKAAAALAVARSGGGGGDAAMAEAN
jgi:hypothetical protein